MIIQRDPVFVQAMANKVYYGPVYFVDGSEPYMTIAVAGSGHDHGVIVGRVNLKFIWEVVSQIKPGTQGYAYVVDSSGRLIADPDISLVLRNTDMSALPQVRAARVPEAGADEPFAAVDRQGKPVLSAHATVTPLNWLVFVELPIDEAYAPLYNSISALGSFAPCRSCAGALCGLAVCASDGRADSGAARGGHAYRSR